MRMRKKPWAANGSWLTLLFAEVSPREKNCCYKRKMPRLRHLRALMSEKADTLNARERRHRPGLRRLRRMREGMSVQCHRAAAVTREGAR